MTIFLLGGGRWGILAITPLLLRNIKQDYLIVKIMILMILIIMTILIIIIVVFT